ncbi:DinB family protein [Chryseobacterium taichungense]|uniref:DinB family protein n=1 Tax=Chryseobacterium taichungense TaxID=295069 RepID=UPI0028A7A100|nr:DinB family protein [Chryseobacterium taichungense]
MNKKYLLGIANYSNWVDQTVISWLEQINDEQWEKEMPSSFSSIAKTTLHLVSAKRIWIDFWNKEPKPVYLSREFKGSKEELLEIWRKIMADYLRFVTKFPEHEYDSAVSINIGNEVWSMEFSQTVLHHNNHASYHRGQLVTLLRNAGFSDFSNTDLATFYVKINRA